MDLLPPILAALYTSIYLILALTLILSTILLIYFTSIYLGTPLSRKLIAFFNPDMSDSKEASQPLVERQRLEAQRRENVIRALGVLTSGLVFVVALIWEEVLLELDRKAFGESWWKMFVTVVVKVMVEGVAVMGFWMVVAAVLP